MTPGIQKRGRTSITVSVPKSERLSLRQQSNRSGHSRNPFRKQTRELEPAAKPPVESSSNKGKRHVWTQYEDILLLRQYLLEEESGKPVGMSQVAWTNVTTEMEKQNIRLPSWRSARDRMTKLIVVFKAENPRDEGKSGQRSRYDEKDKLMVEVMVKKEETARKVTEGKAVKSALEEKRARAESKLMIAAKHGLKKRSKDKGCDDTDSEDEDQRSRGTDAKRTRTTWQSSIAEFFDSNRESQKAKESLEDKKIELERERLEFEKAKERRLTEAAEAQKGFNTGVVNFMAQFAISFGPVMGALAKNMEEK